MVDLALEPKVQGRTVGYRSMETFWPSILRESVVIAAVRRMRRPPSEIVTVLIDPAPAPASIRSIPFLASAAISASAYGMMTSSMR